MRRRIEHLRTVEKKVKIASEALYSGKVVSATLDWVGMDFAGIVFADSTNHTVGVVALTPGSVSGTERATEISNKPYRIRMIEHLMAALWLKRINKILVTVEGNEVPILDGSAKAWVRLIEAAGIKTEFDTKPYEHWPNGLPHLIIHEEIQVEDGDSYLRYTPHPSQFSVDISIDFPYKSIGYQRYNKELYPLRFREEIIPARTFCHVDDALVLKLQGAARGGSLDNTVVFTDTEVLNPEGLRFPDECVRHKVLDLVGDLYTIGLPLLGHIEGHKPNHKINNMLARKLFSRAIEYNKWEEKWI